MKMTDKKQQTTRYDSEKIFHNKWATSEQKSDIDIVHQNEVCTSPEMRKITSTLGDIRGKTILDVGCGLGEASVYFALNGACVTSTDISDGMLESTSRLAQQYGVKLTLHLSQSERLCLEGRELFDVIYLGNLFHHVNIDQTITSLLPYLKRNGTLVSWDPIAYNPIINLYRKIATEVRTPDEHPLKISDLKKFFNYFEIVESHHYWLTTLIIFIIMAVFQLRNPNKERYWKKVVTEGDSWLWLYRPLAKIDYFLLKICPPLKWLCWNIVIIAKHKKNKD